MIPPKPCHRDDSRSLLHIARCASTCGVCCSVVRYSEDMFKDLRVRTVVIPSGDKPSVVADAPEDYAKDTSPDKVSYQSAVVIRRIYQLRLLVMPDSKSGQKCP